MPVVASGGPERPGEPAYSVRSPEHAPRSGMLPEGRLHSGACAFGLSRIGSALGRVDSELEGGSKQRDDTTRDIGVSVVLAARLGLREIVLTIALQKPFENRWRR